jgi:hypothetical protein
MKKKGKEIITDKDNTIDTSPVKTDVYKYPRGNRYNIVYAKTPNNNQHVRRSDEELQKIIDSKPRNWTKKDFLGEGKLNNQKILTRKETDRKTLKFYQTGKRINMKNIFDNSTEESISEFKKGEIDFETLKNRSSTIKWRSNMSNQERKLYDQKVYENLTDEQLEEKKQRQRDYYEKITEKK